MQTSKNRHLSSDRIIVECGIWNVVETKWKWSKKFYDEIFRLYLGLTNLHIKWNPPRAEERRLYNKITNRWYKIGTSQVEKRK